MTTPAASTWTWPMDPATAPPGHQQVIPTGIGPSPLTVITEAEAEKPQEKPTEHHRGHRERAG
jgi:hypothetical protein